MKLSQIIKGNRYRVTLEGLVEEIDWRDQTFLLAVPGNSDAAIWISPDYAVVEDAPLSLPTEPGERFWGSLNKTAPCWWFVRTERGTEGVWYVSQYGSRGAHPYGINSTSIAAVEGRLVRLPDPETTS